MNVLKSPAYGASDLPSLKGKGQYIYTISEAAEFLGVSVGTLRNWEKEGKLIPVRTTGGARRYHFTQLKKALGDKNPYLRNLIQPLSYQAQAPAPVEQPAVSIPVEVPASSSVEAPKPQIEKLSELLTSVNFQLQNLSKIHPSPQSYTHRPFMVGALVAVIAFVALFTLNSFGSKGGSQAEKAFAFNPFSALENVLGSVAGPEFLPVIEGDTLFYGDARVFDKLSVGTPNPVRITSGILSSKEALTLGSGNGTIYLFDSSNRVTNTGDLTMSGTIEAEALKSTSLEIASSITTPSVTGTGDLVLLSTSLDQKGNIYFNSTKSYVNSEGVFTGNGSGLNSLNADSITSGKINNDRLNSNVSQLGDKIDSAEIQDGTIQKADIASDTIDLDNIADTLPLDNSLEFTLRDHSFNFMVNGSGNINADLQGTGDFVVKNNTNTYFTFNNDGSLTQGATAGNVTLTGSTAIQNTLTVTEATTLSSTLNVTGSVAMGSTLSVTGATSLSSILGVTGATTLSSTLEVDGTATFDGTIVPTNFTGNLLPITDATYDVGSAVAQWRNIYLSGNIFGANFSMTGDNPTLAFTDTTPGDEDWNVNIDGSSFFIRNTTDGSNYLTIGGTGATTLAGALTVQGANGIILSNTTADITLGNGETINNDTDGTLHLVSSVIHSPADYTASFTTLDGSTTSNGTGTAATSLIVTDGSNFNIGNYVKIDSTNCVSGVNSCYAKVTDKTGNTLTISPAITWANGSSITEVHVPELGGTNIASTLTNRFGRGYFIDGIVTGNGTTYYTDSGITTPTGTFTLASGATTLSLPTITTLSATSATAQFETLQIGGGYGSTGVTISSNGNISMDGTLLVGADAQFNGLVTNNSNTTLGDTAADTITFVGVINSNVVPDNSTRNFGSASSRWSTGYFDTLSANNISGTVVSGATSNNDWTINSDNATNNAETGTITFERGTPIINAVMQWNASGDAGRVSGYDDNFLFNFPISLYSQVSGATQTFTSGSLFKYGQNATHAITQSGAFIGLDADFSSNITVPNSAAGNQTGSKVTIKDGGASATAIGFQTAGTMDYGLDIGGTIGTADIRLSNGETISNTTDGTISLAATTISFPSATSFTASSATASFDTLNVGGGYGSTGATISSAGAISADGALTISAGSANTELTGTSGRTLLGSLGSMKFTIDTNADETDRTFSWGNNSLDHGSSLMSLTEAGLLTISNGLTVTAGGAAVTAGNLTLSDGLISITDSTTNELLSLQNNDGGALGALISTVHNSASPAVNDAIFQITAGGRDSGGNFTNYGTLRHLIGDTTDTSEDSAWVFANQKAGTLTNVLTLDGTANSIATGGLTITAGGATITAGNLAVNSDTITSDGALSIEATGYVRIGDTGTPGIAGDDDLYVAGWIEVDGDIQVDGGNVGIGAAPISNIAGRFDGTLSGNTSQASLLAASAFNSSATTEGIGLKVDTTVANSAFTMASLIGLEVESGTKGASATVTSAYGALIRSQTVGGTNNYGVYIEAPSGGSTNNIGLYNAGTTTLVGAVSLTNGITVGNGNAEITTAGWFQSNVADRGILNAAGDLQLRAPATTGRIELADLNGSIGITIAPTTGTMWINDISNANMTTGLTINQGGNDDEIFALKSSDITHAMTGMTEADTYFSAKKLSATNGGIEMTGYSAGTTGVYLRSAHTTDDTTKSTSGVGALRLVGALRSGTNVTNLGSNANILSIANNTSTQWIVDAEGDVWQNGDLAVNGNDITFGNGESITNTTDGEVGIAASTIRATTATAWFAGKPTSGTSLNLIRAVPFGYSPSDYRAVQLSSNSLSLGVDVSAITGGNFGGSNEMIFPNAAYTLRQVNAGATDFGTIASINTSGQFTFTNPVTVSSGTSDFNALIVGGGYGSTGTTISSAGAISTDGLITGAGGATITAGNLGVGTAQGTNVGVAVGSTLSGSTIQYGLYSNATYNSAATGTGGAVYGGVNTAASAFTMANAYAFYAAQPVKGAGSTITNAYGFYTAAQNQGSTNNYGVYIEAPSGGSTNNIGLYNAGTSLLAAGVGIGTSPGTSALSVQANSANHLSQFIYTGTTNTAAAVYASNQGSGGTSITNYGIVGSATATGTTSTNIAGYFTASGATNNYGLVVAAGNTGIGTATPGTPLDVAGRVTIRGNSGSGTAAQLGTNAGSTGYQFYSDTAFTSAAKIEIGSINAGYNYGTSLSNGVAWFNGNVGIGTTSPGSKLDINGTVNGTLTTFTQSVANNSIALGHNDTTGYLPGLIWYDTGSNATKPEAGIWAQRTGSGSYLYLGTSNSYATGITNQALTVDYAGNVGIGTTGPGAKLHVSAGAVNEIARFEGSGNPAGVYIYNTGAASNNVADLRFNVTLSGTDTLNVGSMNYRRTGTNTGRLELHTQGTSNAMIIDNGGNVGVGTTSPQSALDLGIGTGGRSLVWSGGGAGWYAGIGTAYSAGDLVIMSGLKLDTTANTTQYSYTGSVAAAGTRYNLSTGAISFFNEAGGSKTAGNTFDTAANTKMTILASGNVGIGTTSPESGFRLDIAGGDILLDSGEFLYAENSAGSNSRLIGRGSGADNDQLLIGESGFNNALRIINGNSHIAFETNNGTAEKMRIAADGNVGIGTTNPSYKFQVNAGGITADGGQIINASGNLSGTTGSGWYGIVANPTQTATTTGTVIGLYSRVDTAAAAISLTSAYGLNIASPVKGAGSTIINNYGMVVNAQTAGSTNNYGIYIDAPSGGSSNNIGLYNIGTTKLTGAVTIDDYASIGATTISTAADLSIGNGAADYPGNSGWAGTYNTNILINSLDTSSIAFHDAGASVGTFGYSTNGFFMDGGQSWGPIRFGVNDRSADAFFDVTGNGSVTPFRVDDSGEGDSTPFIITSAGNVGIGTTNPGTKLQVGARDVNSSAGVLRLAGCNSNCTGNRAFDIGTSGAGSSPFSDHNFHIKDTDLAGPQFTIAYSTGYVGINDASPDAMFDIDSSLTSIPSFQINNTGIVTSTLAQLTANSLTTGTMLGLTSTGITTGKFVDINNGSSIFSISNTDVTTSLPVNFTSPGDVSIAYDINMTNPTASYIKSLAALTIQAGEAFASNNLTLKTYNSGDVVFDAPGGLTLVQAQTWTSQVSSATALNITNSAGTSILDIDTTNNRVGIGTTAPAGEFHVNSASTDNRVYFTNSATGTTAGNGFMVEVDPLQDAYLWQFENRSIFMGTNGSTKLSLNSSGQLVVGDVAGANTYTMSPTTGPTYAGTARPSKTITYMPEYDGGTLTAFYGAGTDTNITGDMTADTETSHTEAFTNYYQWERTTDATMHFHTVALRVKLPKDFSAWETTAITIAYKTESANTSLSKLDYYIYRSDNATAVTSSTNAAGTSWNNLNITTTNLNDDIATDWDAADQTAIIYLRMGSASSNYVRLGEINLHYKAKF